MDMKSTRREILIGSAGAAMLAAMPQAYAQSIKTLTATTRSLEVNGKAAKVFALLGPNGQPGIMLEPGERFALQLENQTATPTSIHWHGQLPDWKQDGFPWPQTPAITAGMSQAYDFAPIPGTFWMHSHEGLQEQQLMAAPLIVQDAASATADIQQVVMMLHDFSFKSPDELLARLTKQGAMSHNDMGAGINMNSGGMSEMGMGPSGMTGGTDLNDIDFDAYLANERTLADPQVVYAAPDQKIRLRIINGASSTNFWIDLGQLTGTVIAVDGHDVVPVAGSKFPIAIAQRLDILVRLPAVGAYPLLAQVEGKPNRTGIILATPGASIGKVSDMAAMSTPAVDLSLESRLVSARPLASRKVDNTIPLRLGGNMNPYAWTLNGKLWPNPDVLMVKPGQRVIIDMVNDSMMSHPMHLHGHEFQVVAINNTRINGAVRDTVLVSPMGRVAIAFDADNPGRWALHCHNLYHMAAGMMTEVRYPGIV
ncbi:MAG: multicopper oxidase family protein [Rhodospirillales bacterium]|nr:multicopper oxidase family protein [Rhodospirillales bacterium]